MSWRWTDSLRPELATALAPFDCVRFERSRRGGWCVLTPSAAGEGTRWLALPDDLTGDAEPMSIVRDKRLGQVPELLGGWFANGCDVRLLAYKPGRRAVFSVTLGDDEQIVKVYHKDRGHRLRWSIAQSCDQLRTPRVLDWDSERRALTTDRCPGLSLNERWLSDGGRATDAEALATVVTELWSSSPPEGLPTHSRYDEIGIVESRLPEYFQTLAAPVLRVESTVQRVSEALAKCSEPETTVCHRDLHDKQILTDDDRVSLIDLDLACLGSAALDVGNMIAHVRLRALKGVDLPWREIAGGFVARVRQHRPLPDLAVWTAATLTRLVLIYSRRKRPEHLLDALLDSANDALERTGDWSEVL